MINKHKNILLALILLLGFVLRFHSAALITLVYDETDDFWVAQTISFDPENLHLPLFDPREESSPVSYKYILKLGWVLFGNSLLGGRLAIVLISILNIFLVYRLVKMMINVPVALLSALLLSVSHFDIGISRVGNINPPQTFILICSLTLFFTALKTSNKILLLGNGIIIGLGFWIKESAVFLIPIDIIFLWICPQFRGWLKSKTLWISFIWAFCIMIPVILISLNPQVPRFEYVRSEATIAPSLISLTLYIGELLFMIAKPFPEIFNPMADSFSMEYPMESFVFGFIILVAVFTSIKHKDPFIRLLVVCFLFNFAAFSVLRRCNVVDSLLSVGSIDWCIFSFVPGVILAAFFIYNFLRRFKFRGAIAVVALIGFMFLRAVDLVTYPLPDFFPLREYYLPKQLAWAQALQEGNIETGNYLAKGNIALAKDTYERIFVVSDHNPDYKRDAAWGLAQMSFEEGKLKESKYYLNYVLSRKPDHSDALELSKEICFRKN